MINTLPPLAAEFVEAMESGSLFVLTSDPTIHGMSLEEKKLTDIEVIEEKIRARIADRTYAFCPENISKTVDGVWEITDATVKLDIWACDPFPPSANKYLPDGTLRAWTETAFRAFQDVTEKARLEQQAGELEKVKAAERHYQKTVESWLRDFGDAHPVNFEFNRDGNFLTIHFSNDKFIRVISNGHFDMNGICLATLGPSEFKPDWWAQR